MESAFKQMALRLSLLGHPQIWLDDQPLTALRSEKARAILFYLAVTQQPQTRTHLAELFWLSDDDFLRSSKSLASPIDRARTNLRHEIKELRKASLDRYVGINDEMLAFNPVDDAELDVVQFENQFAKREPHNLDHLENAVRLYRGPFLDHFEVENAPGFEEWVTGQSGRYEERVFQALRQLTRIHADANRYTVSLQYVERWLDLAPWLEDTHQCKMVLLALNHERERALEYYERRSRMTPFQPETVTLYQRIQAGDLHKSTLDAFLPFANSVVEISTVHIAAKPFQAPALPVTFIGRDAEQNDIRHYMTGSHQPICTIVGMGGIGKSSLAIKAVHDLRYSFDDGVLWADLAYSDPMSVLEMWGMAYGATHLARCRDLGTRSAAFRDLMSNKQALLVLDGAVDLEQVKPLLPNNPRCAVLITTRDHQIGAILRAKKISLKVMSKSDSLQLLISGVGEERIQAEPEMADGILNLLEHLPLAVEIAAQRLAEHPDRTLAQEYQGLKRSNERLKRLSRGKRAVRASFEESWILLGKSGQPETSEQKVFKALGVFEERVYSLEAATYVVELLEEDADETISTLCSLSLIMREGRGRYRLHALLSDFAREKLGQNPRPYQRMADYYAQFAHQHRKAFARLDGEWANLNAGIKAAYEYGLWTQMTQYATALEEAWFALGHYIDARRVYGWLCGATQEVLQEVEPPALGRYFCQWAVACIEQSDYDESKQQIESALEIYEELRDDVGITETKYLLGRVALERGDYEDADLLLKQSLNSYRDFGNQVGTAEAQYLLADIPFKEGRYEEAKALGQNALDVYRQANHQIGVIKSLCLLADICWYELNFTQAEQYCFDALKICDEIHEQAERIVVLCTLAGVYFSTHRYTESLEILERCCARSRELGNQRLLARAMLLKALVYSRIGDYLAAQTCCDEFITIYDRLGNTDYEGVKALRDEIALHLSQQSSAATGNTP